MIRLCIFVLTATVFVFSETHIFWYKALNNHYALTDSPGPALAANSIIHEGKIATCNNSVGLGYTGSGFSCGSNVNDDQGWCSLFYSEDINDSLMTGIVDSAFIRGEYYNPSHEGPPICNGGIINIKCGVVDVAPGLEMWEDFPGGFPDDAVCTDLLLLKPLDYSLDLIEGTVDTIVYMTLSGNPTQPNQLDSNFIRIDITKQIDWIVQHHDGRYAIVFLSPIGQGSTGKFTVFAEEICSLNTRGYYPPRCPWTKDGNTTHLLVYGDLNDSISTEKALQIKTGLKVTIAPNPFNPSTRIAIGQEADIDIYDVNGKLVDRLAAQGSQPLEWNASKLPGGVYFCRVKAGGRTVMGKIVYLR